MPTNDAQFANFFLNPLLAQVLRFDRRSSASGAAHGFADPGAVHGADLSRLRPGGRGPVADSAPEYGDRPTSVGLAPVHRLGFLAGDLRDSPTGGVYNDDVFESPRAPWAGILVDSKKYGTLLGDGVNMPGSSRGGRFPLRRRGV